MYKFKSFFTLYQIFQSEVIPHKQDCLFRITVCPRFDCNKKLKVGELLDHFKSDHKHENMVRRMKKGVREVTLDDAFFTHWPWLMIEPLNLEFDNKTFVFLSYRSDRYKIWYFYVKVIGSKSDAEKYQSIISLTSQNGVSIFIVKHPLVFQWMLFYIIIFNNILK